MKPDLAGKTAVVTGASKGIGYAVAEALAGAGANVVLCARDMAQLDRAVEGLRKSGSGRALGLPCDVRRYENVQRLIAGAVEEFGGLDVLVNNAGVGAFAAIDELTPETWRQVIETNLNGAYYTSHEAIPHLRRRGGGWIINIGSLAGKNPFAGGTAYNASKFGLLGFSEAMMLDVRHYGIRVTCIMPGSVATQFSGPGGHRGSSADWKIQPEDIAEMVLDLLAFPGRTLPSRVEMRPTKPPR